MQKFISWVEIPSKNFDRAVDFYNSIFGFSMQKMDFGHEKMACFPNGEGAITWAPNFHPGQDGTLVSLNTGDQLTSVIDRISRNGGQIVQPKTKIEAANKGYFSVFIDPEGNKLGLYGN
ncbi:MAG: VOC family protein [Bacteroidetes bacterium]|jgi:predicted enzyme related to lactoylglutathione lyase|nr:VOC family protein [Bacteroidota bacterium]